MFPAFKAYPDAAAFLATAGPVLYQWEAQNNLPLGRAELCLAGQTPFASTFFGFDDADSHPLIFVYTEPQSLCLSYCDPPHLELIPVAATALRSRLPHVRDIFGPSAETQHFVECWTGHTAPVPECLMRVHVLHTVAFLDTTRGTVRQARQEDLALAAEWFFAFKQETGHGDATLEAATTQAESLIRNGTLYFLTDGDPVSIAARVRRTRCCSTIGGVYTPQAHRGKGYATALVSILSQQFLDTGDTCAALYTDLSNPTSNAIYARIGYEPLYDATWYRIAGSD